MSDLWEAIARPMAKTANRTTLYHIAKDVDFKLSTRKHPDINSTIGGDYGVGIFLSPSPEYWLNGYGYWRPWIAEFSVPSNLDSLPGTHGGEGGEVFVPAEHYDKIHLNRIIPLDAFCREEYGAWGWVEVWDGKTFDTEMPFEDKSESASSWADIYPWKGYRYPGDARQTDPGWQQRYKKRVSNFARHRGNAFASKTAKRKFFHATDAELNPGDVLVPGKEIGKDNWDTEFGPEYVWMMTDADNASVYGGRLYEVEPIGEAWNFSKDSGEEMGDGVKSFEEKSPKEWEWVAPRARVIRRLAAMRKRAGWITCSDGQVRWGPWGAAGVLFRHRNEDGLHYLLAKRGPHVDQGGTWAIPGGALNRGETPIDAALREAREELNASPRDYVVATIIEDRPVPEWAYWTVVVDVSEPFVGSGFDWETDEMGWFSAAEVTALDLHPAFKKSWPKLRAL